MFAKIRLNKEFHFKNTRSLSRRVHVVILLFFFFPSYTCPTFTIISLDVRHAVKSRADAVLGRDVCMINRV